MHSALPKFETNPIEQMDHLRGVISQEAFSFAGIKRSLSQLLPDMQRHFESFTHSFLSKEDPVQLKGNEKDFVKLIEGRVYLNLAPLLAHVPEGLKVPYLEYLVVLKDVIEHCKKNTMSAMGDYSVYLAQVITNPALRVSSPSHAATYKKMESERTELVSRMAECFQEGSHKSNSTYGAVVKRNAEWVDVFKIMHVIEDIANSMDRSAMHKKAQECNDQLNKIIDMIRHDKFEGSSPELTTNLADGAFQTGSELELFALTYFRIMVVTNAIGETMKTITKIVEQ